MKKLTQYINEYLIKKKLDKVRSNYKYTPKTKVELQEAIIELLSNKETNFNCIDTSKIEDMSRLFINSKITKLIGRNDFDVSEWNVSNVKDMNNMFNYCKHFTGKGLENWDVSKVEDMSKMFYDCWKFNCDLSKWNVSNVKDMKSMFSGCYLFDSDLSRWDVSNVEDMHAMFFLCKNFIGNGLEYWDVRNVKYMDVMFSNCKKLDCNLETWDVSNCKDIRNMFVWCNNMKNKPSWYKE